MTRKKSGVIKSSAPKSVEKKLIPQLLSLSANEFENLAFDLMVSVGLQNVCWRTPGADGGRDIEGDHFVVDLSGHKVRESWYVECKRYASAVDWPTVFEKVTYATNHETDYLLFLSTSTPSPNCASEISKWNASRRWPKIRFWGGPELENILLYYPQLVAKYSLSDAHELKLPWNEPAVQLLAKATLSAYGSSVLKNNVSSSIERAAAIAELILGRYEELLKDLPFAIRGTNPDVDIYPWVSIKGKESDLRKFDSRGLRLLLASVKDCLQLTKLSLTIEPQDKLRISSTVSLKMNPGVAQTFQLVAVNSNIVANFEGTDIVATLR